MSDNFIMFYNFILFYNFIRRRWINSFLTFDNFFLTISFLTSSLRTPKFFVKEFCYFLMSCHQHCLGINLLVQR